MKLLTILLLFIVLTLLFETEDIKLYEGKQSEDAFTEQCYGDVVHYYRLWFANENKTCLQVQC